MFKDVDPWRIKSIVLVGLILGSILLVNFTPFEITHSAAFQEIHGLGR